MLRWERKQTVSPKKSKSPRIEKSNDSLRGQRRIDECFKKDDGIPLARKLEKLNLNGDQSSLEKTFGAMVLTPKKKIQSKLTDTLEFKRKLFFDENDKEKPENKKEREI